MAAPAERKGLDARLDQVTPGEATPYLRTFAHLSGRESFATPPSRWGRYALATIVILSLGGAGWLGWRFATGREGPAPFESILAQPQIPLSPPPTITPRSTRAFVSIDPPRRPLRLRIGEARDFVATAKGTEATYRWSIDKHVVSKSPRWTYEPSVAQLGRRRVALEVKSADGTARRRWTVSVRPPRPPKILTLQPAREAVEMAVGERLPMKLTARPSTSREKLSLAWTINGKAASTSDTLVLKPRRAGVMRVRAVASTDLGAQLVREWRVTAVQPVEAAPPEGTAVAENDEPREPARRDRKARAEEAAADDAPPEPRASEQPAELPHVAPPLPAEPEGVQVGKLTIPQAPPPPVAAEPAPPPPAAAPSAPSTHPSVNPASPGAPRPEDVQNLLERYAAALRNHDVQALRAIGQVTNDDQAQAMQGYFANVGDIDVEFRLLGMRWNGDSATVLFTRLDRFKDPAGRPVTHESPPVEKAIKKTPQGLKFVLHQE
jgi:hypothetical protein